MQTKINNLSDVFREAKEHLWDGEGDWVRGNEFICHAIHDVSKFSTINIVVINRAKEIIQNRLGESKGAVRTVRDYLCDVFGLHDKELTFREVQQYRRDWLTSLEEEFKPKLKPKKGYSVHHIDGNLRNNTANNLNYVRSVK